MRKYFVFGVLMVMGQWALGQNYPLYNSYFTNQYLYNPAEAGSRYFNVFSGYRTQWLGMNGAPKLTTLGVQTLLNNTRVGIGFKGSSFKRGFLNTSDVSVAYAYGIPINKQNKLFFGLSGGIMSNSIDWQLVEDNSDPALANISRSPLPSLTFGMALKSASGLNLGIALPKLIKPALSSNNFSIAPQDNILIMASYSTWQSRPKILSHNKSRATARQKNSEGSPFEFYSLFRYSGYGSQMEGTVKYNFNSSLYISATYRKVSGFIPGLGINLNKLSFNYFYESGLGGDIPLKSHELSLSLRLGQEKKFRGENKPVDKHTTPGITPKSRYSPPKISKNTKKPGVISKPTDPAITQTTKPAEVLKNETQVVQPKEIKPIAQKDEKVELRKEAKTDSITEKPDEKNPDPIEHQSEDDRLQHLDEQEKLARLKEHQDNPTAEHTEEGAPHKERHEFVKRGNHTSEMNLGDYVIVGVFKNETNAKVLSDGLKKLGFTEVDYGYLTNNNLWYVHIAGSNDINEAKEKRDKYRGLKMFKDAWLLTVHQ